MESSARVQHVTKASSDQLLSKFAEIESESESPNDDVSRAATKALHRAAKRRVRRMSDCKSPLNLSSTRWTERRSLLPMRHVPRSTVVLRQLHRARDLKSRSILGSIEKTWRKTLEGASRVFGERHYNSHKRLMSDTVS